VKRVSILAKSATACRSKVFAAFINAPKIRRAQNGYILLYYQRILPLVCSGQKIHPDEVSDGGIAQAAMGDEAANTISHKSREETIAHLQDCLLFDVL
jgi:hypothetical protein